MEDDKGCLVYFGSLAVALIIAFSIFVYQMSKPKQYPKVPVYVTIDTCIRYDLDTVQEGWYCLPVVHGLTMANNEILGLAIRQKDLDSAIKACMVHNTYNDMMTKIESASLLIQFGQVKVPEYTNIE